MPIGTGSGYAAAVLAEIADQVYTVERFGSGREGTDAPQAANWPQPANPLLAAILVKHPHEPPNKA